MTMQAIVQDAYGTDPEAVLRLSRTEQPTIESDEIVVSIAAASIDMGTWHLMTGMPYAMRAAGFGLRAPKALNPGRSLAGTVDQVGTDVNGFTPGDEVYGTCEGSFAEFVRTKPDMLSPKPSNISFEQAAALPISGSTALQAVHKARVTSGQRVLVIGASGGVGAFAVQIAKAAGAEVTGVCRAEKVDFVRSLGAAHVIDYEADDFTRSTVRYDVIIDTGGNRRLSDLRRVMTQQGTLVIVGGESGGRWLGGFERSLAAVVRSPFAGQRLGMLTSKENADDLATLRTLVEAGHVTPSIDRTYPLDETPAALSHFMDGHVCGKVVITINEQP